MGAGVVAVVFAVTAVIARVVHQSPGLGTFDVVATVDGEPIVYGELQQSVDAERSQVSAYFRAKYGAAATNASTFWTTRLGGEIPAQRLRKAALARSVQIKLEQIVARKQGIVADISYRSSVDAMQRVNKQRQAVVDKGGIVFGPVAYDEKTYFDQQQRDVRKELEAKLGAAVAVSDGEVSTYYTQHKRQFWLGESRRIAAISFTAAGTAGAPDAAGAARLEVATARLAKLQQRIDAGAPFDVIFAEVRRADDGVLTASEHDHDYRTMRADALASPSLAQVAGELPEGAVSRVVQDDRSAGIYKCVEVRSLGYIPLAQVKPRILSALREHKYDGLVRRWRAKADVKIVAKAMALVAVG